MHVSFNTYHDCNDHCAVCSGPFKPRKRGRHVVTLEDEPLQMYVNLHKHCYKAVKPDILSLIQPTCMNCGAKLVLEQTETYLPARVRFDDAHDDELACTVCILDDVESSNSDDIFEMNCQLARTTKRMLDDGYIQDEPAKKRMRRMNEESHDFRKRLRLSNGYEQRMNILEEQERHMDNYESFMIATYKKHMMDECHKGVIASVFRPSNYKKWLYTIDEDDLLKDIDT